MVSQSNYYLMQGADLKCMRADILKEMPSIQQKPKACHWAKAKKACCWICSC